jgi:predicted ArsR family transcriptional regulator
VDPDDEDLDALGLLQDPARRALYRYVAGQPGDVSRSEAAGATGIPRGLAAFHLDKLADAGLLEVSYRRLGGRTGPGAGRPAKLYRRAARERAVSVPPRAYATAARLLAQAVEDAGADLALHAVARRQGEEEGRAATSRDVVEHLTLRGFEPYEQEGVIRLRNCPFHSLAREFPAVVCGMNLELLTGLLQGLGATDVTAAIDPRPGECCVALHPAVSKTNKN